MALTVRAYAKAKQQAPDCAFCRHSRLEAVELVAKLARRWEIVCGVDKTGPATACPDWHDSRKNLPEGI